MYSFLFFNIIKKSYFGQKKYLSLFYPSFKFVVKTQFPNYYFTTISRISSNLLYFHLKDNISREDIHNKRKNNIQSYIKKLRTLKTISILPIEDFNYQNFLEFPLLVKNKNELMKYLLANDIDCRFYYYLNCSKFFKKNNLEFSNSQYFEDHIICLPCHHNVKLSYIEKICDLLIKFDKKNNEE